MSDSSQLFIGIDISTHRNPFTYAAFTPGLELLALGAGKIEDVLAYTAGQNEALVCINAPYQPNQGLMQERSLRQSLFPDLPPGRWTNLRVAEYELHLKGFHLPKTPDTVEESPKWMRSGFETYRHLEKLGYKKFPAQEPERQLLETSSEVVFQIWINDGTLLEAKTLEGRLQRQLILYILGLPVNNPLKIFEEITRHRLFQGIIPTETIYSPAEINAIATAYFAWLAFSKPDSIMLFGAEEEGQIALPKESLHL